MQNQQPSTLATPEPNHQRAFDLVMQMMAIPVKLASRKTACVASITETLLAAGALADALHR